jgi:hypothetical protein
VRIVGAYIDWCEFEIQKEPEDLNAFAEAIYRICPDIVEQGTNTIAALQSEIKKTKRVFLWWD